MTHKFAVLVLPVKRQVVATCSLLAPLMIKFLYVNKGTIHEFENEISASTFIKDNLQEVQDEFDILIPGTPESLDFYRTMWIEAGDYSLQDVPALIQKLKTGSYNFNYMKEDSDSFKQAIDECENPPVYLKDSNTGAWTGYHYMQCTESELLKVFGINDTIFIPPRGIEFEDLTIKDQEKVILSISGKGEITLGSGAMYDLHFERTYNYPHCAALVNQYLNQVVN